MAKYFVLLSTKNFLNITPKKKFSIEFNDNVTINFRQFSDQRDETLSNVNMGWLIEVELFGENIDETIAKAIEISNFFLYIISLETGHPINDAKPILIYDINEEVEKRAFRQYFYDTSIPVIGADLNYETLFDSTKKLYQYAQNNIDIKGNHRISRAMKWFKKGLTSVDVLDQFIFFWHGLESLNPVLANYYGVNNSIKKEIDKKCPHCGKKIIISVDGGIESLYEDLEIDEQQRKEIKDIRNGISHGFEDLYSLTSKAQQVIPLLAQILYQGIYKILNLPCNIRTIEMLKKVDPIKINDFMYIEGYIMEKNLSKIGVDNYYPHLKLNISNNEFTPENHFGCDISTEKIATSGKKDFLEVKEIKNEK